MANQPALIRQADVTRAVKGARNAGVNIDRVEVEGGKVIIFAKPAEQTSLLTGNTWNDVLNEKE